MNSFGLIAGTDWVEVYTESSMLIFLITFFPEKLASLDHIQCEKYLVWGETNLNVKSLNAKINEQKDETFREYRDYSKIAFIFHGMWLSWITSGVYPTYWKLLE